MSNNNYNNNNQPYRLPQIISTRARIECPKCGEIAKPFVPKGYDNSSGPYSKCSNEKCAYVGKSYTFIHKAESPGPLGSIENLLNKDPTYTVIQSRRTSPKDRNKLNRGKNQEVEEIPHLAGKPDRDLEVLLEGGILINLQDDAVNDEDEIQHDRYSD